MDKLAQTILEMVKERHIQSGGNNGYAVAPLRYDLNVSYEDLKTALKKLENEGRIFFRTGSATTLVCWNSD